MSKVNIQSAIAEYLKMMAQMGMEMHSFHANWHENNRDPQPPLAPDTNWGFNNKFGNDFLQMHHEMVKAADDEQKLFMHHQSIVSWFQAKQYDIPTEWNPLTPIPAELSFDPIDVSLRRKTDDPHFALPKYFTVAGIAENEQPEPITRSKKLADFKNLNQLGCCIVYPHNAWHAAIGGAMLYFETAIDDPIFYFGVHWQIEKVFNNFKIEKGKVVTFEKVEAPEVPVNFSNEEKEKLKTAEQLGLKIRK